MLYLKLELAPLFQFSWSLLRIAVLDKVDAAKKGYRLVQRPSHNISIGVCPESVVTIAIQVAAYKIAAV